MIFQNKKIFIFGMARSGYEAAKLLSKYNNTIIITDANDQNEVHVEELLKLGVKFIKTSTPEDILDDTYDYVVKNPGIKIDHPLLIKAQQLNIPITNEVDVAFSFMPKNINIIGITGSNGKTTTTTITYNILKNAGLPVHLGGNIGFPVCSLVDNIKENDTLVLEISSHQLHDMKDFKTNISILTNLSEVHIDHFKTYENYMKQKIKIFNNHTSSDIAIINKENIDSINQTQNIASHKLYFSSKEKADIYVENNKIYYNNEAILNLSKIQLQGTHNYENIMCAILVVKQFNVPNEIIQSTLATFNGVPHRLEFVAEINKRKFYNDSKATNVKSTQIALSAFDSPTILLLGGLDRRHSFDGLVPFMKNVKHIICFGETKNRIKQFANDNKKDCTVLDNLTEAAKHAYEISNQNDIILLSPACASWDQYKCFEDRGDEFKKIVTQLA